MSEMGREFLALLSSFAGDNRGAEHDISGKNGIIFVSKREHVGGVIFPAVITIEPARFGFGDQAYGDFGVPS